MNQKNNATNTPPEPKSLTLQELKKILMENYKTFPAYSHTLHKDKDCGDLWHIYHGGAFVDERFVKSLSGESFTADEDKEIALRLICQGRYGENDLVRIGFTLIDEYSDEFDEIETDEERYRGFALTKDSFCLKGLGSFDCIIPYGNIKEVQRTNLGDVKIFFYKNETETAYVKWGRLTSDIFTSAQLQKYLNKVKKFYSPDYDKLFIGGGNFIGFNY